MGSGDRGSTGTALRRAPEALDAPPAPHALAGHEPRSAAPRRGPWRRLLVAVALGIAGWALLALVGDPAQASTSSSAPASAASAAAHHSSPASAHAAVPSSGGRGPAARALADRSTPPTAGPTSHTAAEPHATGREASRTDAGGAGTVTAPTVAGPARSGSKVTTAPGTAGVRTQTTAADRSVADRPTGHESSRSTALRGDTALRGAMALRDGMALRGDTPLPLPGSATTSPAHVGGPPTPARAPLPDQPSPVVPPPCPATAGTGHGGPAGYGPAVVAPAGSAVPTGALAWHSGGAPTVRARAAFDDPACSPD